MRDIAAQRYPGVWLQLAQNESFQRFAARTHQNVTRASQKAAEFTKDVKPDDIAKAARSKVYFT